MKEESVRLYEFGSFRLNASERFLQNGDTVVPLAPKVFDTLLVLVENNGRVIEKNKLMELLWPDTFVEESSLTQNIFLIRKALGDLSSDRRYIETIPKRGYRFIANVREICDPSIAIIMKERTSTQILIAEDQIESEPKNQSVALNKYSHRSKRQHTALLSLCVVIACLLLGSVVLLYLVLKSRGASDGIELRSIAVLPFKTVGADTQKDLLGLGMADALIMRLSRLEQPTVLPTSSVFNYTQRDKDALAIGRDLGVDAVIDGTLQRDGDRIRISAQLIRLKDAKTIWVGTFDEKYGDIFALQDSISEQLVSQIAATVASPPILRPRLRPTESAEAYEAYLTGVYFWNRRTTENLTKAIGYLEEAVRMDPEFALGHAVLADCYYLSSYKRGGEVLVNPESLKLADVASKRALELDDSLAEAHTVRAGLLLSAKDMTGADREFDRVLKLNPDYAVGRLRYAYFLFANSRLDEALAQMTRAQELDPVSPTTNTALGYLLMMRRDYDSAIRSFEKALEIQPDLTAARVNLCETYVLKGLFKEALAEIEKLADVDPSLPLRERVYAYGASGRRQEARRLLSELHGSKNHTQIAPYEYAVIYAALGDKEAAFEWLEKVELNRSMVARLRVDPQMDPLRPDSRFDEYLRRVR